MTKKKAKKEIPTSKLKILKKYKVEIPLSELKILVPHKAEKRKKKT